MSDLGLARYAGYATLGPAGALKARLAREQPAHLEHGVHLIVVQGDDGTLVVGDSHHYALDAGPVRAGSDVDALILQEFRSRARHHAAARPGTLERHLCVGVR